MRMLVVRVSKAEVWVKGENISSIKEGLAVFAGFYCFDTHSDLAAIAEKLVNLRVFEDEQAKLNYSVKDKGLEILCIPNFTLCANINKGRRPSFEQAMQPKAAEKFFGDFILLLESKGVEVKKGIFGAHMDTGLVSDGPINIILDSKGSDT